MVKSVDRYRSKKQFLEMALKITNSSTAVKEHIQLPLTYKENVLEVISNEDPGTIIWQHTDKVHVACIYIKQGSGYDYSRSGIDLYNVFEHNGIDMTDLDQIGHYFDVAWEHTNDAGSNFGIFPKVTSSITRYERSRLESYIIRDESIPENVDSSIPKRKVNRLDRTHLIPVSVTGIENNRSVLIMFDSWLNQNTLREFEERILRITRHQDVIWWVVITKNNQDPKHLDWNYIILDSLGNVLDSLRVTDDRWSYNWYYDDRYQSLGW